MAISASWVNARTIVIIIQKPIKGILISFIYLMQEIDDRRQTGSDRANFARLRGEELVQVQYTDGTIRIIYYDHATHELK